MGINVGGGYPSDEADPCSISSGGTSCQYQQQAGGKIETDPGNFLSGYTTQQKDTGQQNTLAAPTVVQTTPNPPFDIVVVEGVAIGGGDEGITGWFYPSSEETRGSGSGAWELSADGSVLRGDADIPISTLSSGLLARGFDFSGLPENLILAGIEVEIDSTVFGYAPGSDAISLLDCLYVTGEWGDLTKAGSLDASFNASGDVSFARDITFNTTGSKMFLLDSGNSKIFEYPLSTPGLVSSTGASTANKAVPSNSISAAFKPDGMKLFVLSITSSPALLVTEYPLSSAWDLSTLGAATDTFVPSSEAGAASIAFSADGDWMYIAGVFFSSVTIKQYPLSTGWDLTTASAYTKSKAGAGGSAKGLVFNPDGTRLYSNSTIAYKAELTTPWDITTLQAPDVSHSINGTGTEVDITFNPAGDVLYSFAYSPATVQQFNLDN